MVNIEKNILDLVGRHYGKPLFGKGKELSLDLDIDTDLNLDEYEAKELMDEFFSTFNVLQEGFKIETYYPEPHIEGGMFSLISLLNPFSKIKITPVMVPDFTIRMIVESAKAGRWLY